MSTIEIRLLYAEQISLGSARYGPFHRRAGGMLAALDVDKMSEM
jgi:hypothetical protein